MNSTSHDPRAGRRALAAAPTDKEKRTTPPALAHYIRGLLLGQVWQRRRPASRDRSLVTVSALVAAGQVAQVTDHLFTNDSTGNDMELKRVGAQPSMKGPAEYFTGAVRVDPLSPAHPPSRVSVASVTFEPGARSAWHTHPLGQTLVVTAGCGWTRCEGGPIVEIRAGDVVWCPPGHKHWHGASKTTAMTHLAIQEALDGVNVVWLEKVSDEEYEGGPAAADHTHG